MGGDQNSRPEVCAVLVNYRCAEDSLRCLESLRRHAPGLWVLVIDNGSGDDSVQVLTEALAGDQNSELLLAEANRGFGAGCNLGIDYAIGQRPDLDCLLLLNPDTVVTAGFLDALLETFEQEFDVGIVGGRILSMDGNKVLFENGRLRPLTLTRSHVRAPRGLERYETSFITGALMLVAADLLRNGLRFDERFFLYVEDLDFCCQVRALGRELWIDRRAVVHHVEGGSQRGEQPVLFSMRRSQLSEITRGKLLFARKHFGPVQFLLFLMVTVFAKPLIGLLTGHLRFLPIYYRAVLSGLGIWRGYNRAVYGLSYHMRNRGRRQRGYAMRQELRHLSQAQFENEILYLAWGRIGDGILATGFLRELRRALPNRRIRVVGRPELETVLKDVVDEFLPFDERRWLTSSGWRRDFVGQLGGGGEILICDVHMFYGGVFTLRGLLEALPCKRKFLYEGYELGAGLAPWREEPLGVEVVPKLAGRGRSHMLAHQAWYLQEILRRIGTKAELRAEDLRPTLVLPDDGGDVARSFGLEPGSYVAFQPVSNNRKKDYPLDRWRQVLAAFPEQRFIALGSAREAARIDALDASNLQSLAGQTDLLQSLQIIRSAGCYLGLDSGLSHAAAALNVHGLCIAQNANLGFFFPYPEILKSSVRSIHNLEYERCAGCFMTCSEESIFSTYLRGAKCLRELPAEAVIEAFRHTAVHT